MRNAVITLGVQGVFVKNRETKAHVAAFDAGPVVETTGGGRCFQRRVRGRVGRREWNCWLLCGLGARWRAFP